MRVVSLLPSATEIVYALGLDHQLVGVSFECDEPARARTDKTVVVSGRDTSGMSAKDIDTYVREQMAAGRDLYTLDAGALAELAPDVILTQDLCRVCALPSDHVDDALSYLGCTADVVSLDPYSLADVLETIGTVGARTGVPERSAVVVDGLQQRLALVAAAVADRPRPRVAVLEWIDPPFTGGHWVPDLVTAAGGEPVATTPNSKSLQTTYAEVAAAHPDVVLVAPCGYHLDAATEQAAAVVEQLPGVAVWALDADGIIVRPGPRLVDGVEVIASVLHPDVVAPRPAGARRVA